MLGLDVSRSMLEEATRNCARFGAGNIECRLLGDALHDAIPKELQFLHSRYCLLSISSGPGLHIAEAARDTTIGGGIGALCLTHARRTPVYRQLLGKLAHQIPLEGVVIIVIHRRPLSYPIVHMNEYDLNDVLALLQNSGCHGIHVCCPGHSGYLGTMLLDHAPVVLS